MFCRLFQDFLLLFLFLFLQLQHFPVGEREFCLGAFAHEADLVVLVKITGSHHLLRQLVSLVVKGNHGEFLVRVESNVYLVEHFGLAVTALEHGVNHAVRGFRVEGLCPLLDDPQAFLLAHVVGVVIFHVPRVSAIREAASVKDGRIG